MSVEITASGVSVDGMQEDAHTLVEAVSDLTDIWQPDDLLTVLRLHHDLRRLRDTLTEGERMLEDWATKRMAYGKTVELPGVGAVKPQGGKERKAWDHPSLAVEVTRHADATADGEVITDPAVAAARVRELLMSAAGISYWKVTTLRALGIEVDEFCTTTPGRKTLAWISDVKA